MVIDCNDQLGNWANQSCLLLLQLVSCCQCTIFQNIFTWNLGPKESTIRPFKMLRGWFSIWSNFFSHKLRILGVTLKTSPYFFKDSISFLTEKKNFGLESFLVLVKLRERFLMLNFMFDIDIYKINDSTFLKWILQLK